MSAKALEELKILSENNDYVLSCESKNKLLSLDLVDKGGKINQSNLIKIITFLKFPALSYTYIDEI